MPLMREVLGTDGALLDTVGIEVDGAGPQPCDDASGLLWNLVMHGASLGMPESTALGDAILAPGSSDVTSPGVAGLLLQGSPVFPPCLLIEGGWRMTWSSRIHRSPSQSGCYTRCWPRSARTSCI
jgi:hypothetical protein